jgi:hypothetical protein
VRRVIGLLIGLVLGLTTVVAGVSATSANAANCAYYFRVWVNGHWEYICIPILKEIPTAGPEPCRCPPDFAFDYKFDPRILERTQYDVLAEVARGFGLLDEAAWEPSPEVSRKLVETARQTFAAAGRQLKGTEVSIGDVVVVDAATGGGAVEPIPWLWRAGTDVGNGIWHMSKGSADVGMTEFQQAYKQLAAGG